MKIYDTHSDIFYNLATRSKEENNSDPFKKYHLVDLLQGEVNGGIWVVYSDSQFDVVKMYEKALECFLPYEKDFKVVKGLEGLRNVNDLETFDKLYKMGIRHASLTWNEENHLAGGAKSNGHLTETGKTFIKYMNEHHMIIDVSHLNEQSFYEVLNEKPNILIASHSNSYTLCNHIRNLKDEQLEALRKAGGMVGVVSARNFVSSDKNLQNIKGFVNQIDYLVSKMGIDNIMLGLDMMNYLSDFNNSNLDDLCSHAYSQLIPDEMRLRGYLESDIEKVCYKNFERLIERIK